MMYSQRGVGMIEVLVSLLILAIAVLGFVALQVRAIQASQDALIKTQAMHFMQSISESLRANKDAKLQYATSINTYSFAQTQPVASVNCTTSKCTADQFATYEAYDISTQASNFGIRLGMTTCPGIVASTTLNLKRLCIFSVWEDTQLKGTAAALDYSDCMTSTGSYVSSSKCLMMETY
ncbi:type IV pilus modification protein PilV [Acinetobacter sp. 187]|uniref:type IV pilus modification protein PilV n=1 Tax=Acinetobacter lanii TaxID=2715163 RepID=UPI001407F190|nr:type IV pilus modification protein PilV [Acinetobacter lanii]NHC02901.1 type IV pilus modification protein PilV [Acinetobacter lanii]